MPMITNHSSMYGTIQSTTINNNNNNNNNNVNTNNFDSSSSSTSADMTTLKNSIYRSREVTRLQCKEMHDLDLSLREADILIGSKYDELKYLQYDQHPQPRPITPATSNYQHSFRPTSNDDQQSNYDTINNISDNSTMNDSILGCLTINSYSRDDLKPSSTSTTIKEQQDNDSGINSLISDDSNNNNNNNIIVTHQQQGKTTQLETLV